MPTQVATPAQKLSGRQKAAALLISLGPEASAQVLKHFNEAEIEALTMEIFQMEKIDEGVKDQVLEDCYHLALAQDYLTSGGLDYARDILVRAIGPAKANELIERLVPAVRPQRFEFAREADPGQLAQFIGNEHPQTIALILSHLPPQQAAQTLINVQPPEVRTEVAVRIAKMDRTPPDVVEQVEEVLRKKFSSVVSRDFTSAGGTQFLVNILTSVDRGTEKSILDHLDASNAELAEEVRKLMFVFEDLTKLDNRSIQRVLREVDNKDLVFAMRGISAELQDKVYRNLSTRAAQALREEMEVSGPVRLRQVEEAQQRIVAIVRKLEAAEEIMLQRSGEDVLV